jgi:hypothetical protein
MTGGSTLFVDSNTLTIGIRTSLCLKHLIVGGNALIIGVTPSLSVARP